MAPTSSRRSTERPPGRRADAGTPSRAASTGLAAQLVAEEAGAFGPLVDAESAGHRVKLVGATDLDGEAVWHLELVRDSGRAEQWYLGRASHLPVRRVTVAEHRRRGEYPRQTFMIEWRAFEGPKGPVRFPVAIEREDNQHVRAFNVEEVTINPEIDPALFVPPLAEPES